MWASLSGPLLLHALDTIEEESSVITDSDILRISSGDFALPAQQQQGMICS